MTPVGHAVVLYRRGPAWEDGKPLGDQRGVGEHIGFLVERHREGVVERAGPFHGRSDMVPANELVGLALYRVGAERAAEYTRDDPGVRAGLLEFSVLPWYL